MTFVVPFDGSEISAAALGRAVEYGSVLDEDTVAVSIVPERKRYAREKGWIREGETYDVDAVIEQLREQVSRLAPDATFEHERIREYPPSEEIADHIRRIAARHDPTVMFLGSENVGSVITPLTSVAANVAAEKTYDVYIVRHRSPPEIEELAARSERSGQSDS
ncbi:universal stress protein [Halostella sp. JP-L12]|uniref:universal stress protein n=1 Tax=Halostella TaxID=1843185 RepID=UPI000EF7EE03|nr:MULTISPECIES: universal stress protein [Halostella]NHN49389.1 universal stress protein [Halostella sp. JP-L12]